MYKFDKDEELNVGKQFQLPVNGVVSNNGLKYLIRYKRIPLLVKMFSEKENSPVPKHLYCKMVSVNEYGYPTFEQVKTPKANVVEPAKTEVHNISGKNGQETLDGKLDDPPKPKRTAEKAPTLPKTVSLSYYIWSPYKKNLNKWLIETGGVKERIEILILLAEQLADYHRKNMVYKEIVPDYINIEVTKGKMRVAIPETNYHSSGLGNLFISGSASAPEVVNRRMPNTPMSDCYSFAIIAYELLEFRHPFVGDAVNNGDAPIEDAYKGKLPWIDDKTKTTNRLNLRLDGGLYTTKAIHELFRKTFEEGKDSPFERPTIFEWLDALYDAKSHLAYCPHCKTDYFPFNKGYCPLCHQKQEFPIMVQITRVAQKWDNETFRYTEEMEINNKPVDVLFANPDNDLTISSRHMLTDSINVSNILKLSVHDLDEKGNVTVDFEPLNGNTIYMTLLNGKRSKKADRNFRSVFSPLDRQTLVLSLNELNTPQRVMIIQLNKPI